MDVLKIFLTVDFYSATLRLATPLVFAVLGGVISERSGILNMALEGQILMGAFFGYLGALYTGSAMGGLFVAMLGSMFLAAIHAFMSIKVKVNQVISAVGLNMMAVGITSTLFRFLFGMNSTMEMSTGFKPISIPGLSSIPFIGPVLFGQNPLFYLAILCLILVQYFLYHTSRGLELRAAGENPHALDVAGVNAVRIRWISVLVCGAFCGVAGACLTITGLNTFYDNISSGRGFIAYAAIVFGKWSPLGSALACLLFGAGDALQLRMQALSYNIPYYFYLMMPYLITFIALLFMGASQGPAASNKPFETDKARRSKKARSGGK